MPPPCCCFGGAGLLHAAIQEGHDLRTGAVVVGAEGSGGSTGSNTVLHGPQDRIGVVGVSGHIREGIHGAGNRELLRAPQEGDDLGAGTGHVRAECGIRGANRDTLLHGPQHGVVVVAASLHIGKGHGAGLGSGRTGGAPQEGYGLGAGRWRRG